VGHIGGAYRARNTGLASTGKERTRVRITIPRMWTENGQLPGLDENDNAIQYWNGLGQRLCSECATDVLTLWSQQDQRCASEMGADEIEWYGHVVYRTDLPVTYEIIHSGPDTYCDSCDQPI
jgi:hypothetical protein